MSVYVRVRVGAEVYAIPVEHVLEVSELGDVAAVPGTASTTLGVRNLRGEVVSVYDLAGVLGLGRDEPAARLLVAEDDGELVGVIDVPRLFAALGEAT